MGEVHFQYSQSQLDFQDFQFNQIPSKRNPKAEHDLVEISLNWLIRC